RATIGYWSAFRRGEVNSSCGRRHEPPAGRYVSSGRGAALWKKSFWKPSRSPTNADLRSRLPTLARQIVRPRLAVADHRQARRSGALAEPLGADFDTCGLGTGACARRRARHLALYRAKIRPRAALAQNDERDTGRDSCRSPALSRAGVDHLVSVFLPMGNVLFHASGGAYRPRSNQPGHSL